MTTEQRSVTPEDLVALWEENPLAKAQLLGIVKTRLLMDAQSRIEDLEAQLEAQLEKKNGKQVLAVPPES